jgi:hypothetical protein
MYVALLLLNIKDDLYSFSWHSYKTLNPFKLIRNKEVMRFENRRGPKIKIKMFYKLEKLLELECNFQWEKVRNEDLNHLLEGGGGGGEGEGGM